MASRPAPRDSEAELEEKRVKLEQLKVRQRRLENRIKYLQSRQARRDDTRRKILIGAAILAKIERGEFDEKKLRALLDSVLTRKDDRELFGLK
ncbi:MAG: mobilization protein [Proteobacteria bacterium]|nr:mobilization protein [Pseudomonadota bacterium]